jgi:hypothetical protein
LLPGDIILTGTPPGVGAFAKPPLFLKVFPYYPSQIKKFSLSIEIFHIFSRKVTSWNAKWKKSESFVTKSCDFYSSVKKPKNEINAFRSATLNKNFVVSVSFHYQA